MTAQMFPTRPARERVIERELPRVQPDFLIFQCLHCTDRATVLHRGTAYCRAHYDEGARMNNGKLIDY